jgi:Ser/Thr protein kinase RdoA (MazF antagonist)
MRLTAANTTPDLWSQSAQRLAHEAAEFLSLGAIEALTLLNASNNAVFRAETATGVYTMRIHRPGYTTAAEITSELVFLEALSREAELGAPVPAGPLFIGSLADETSVHVAAFHWIVGESRSPAQLTPDDMRGVGIYAARLHDFSQYFSPPDGFIRPRRDWDGLFGERSHYAVGTDEVFTDPQRAIFEAVAAEVRRRITVYADQADVRGLIHADLIPRNLLWRDGEVCAIDFDDCAWGYYLYDLAPSLWFARSEPGYEAARKALWEGYTAIRPQAEDRRDLLEAFVAARHVASCRWLAGNRHHPSIADRFTEILNSRIAELHHFLDTGMLTSVAQGG